jgi:hypothetical protein
MNTAEEFYNQLGEIKPKDGKHTDESCILLKSMALLWCVPSEALRLVPTFWPAFLLDHLCQHA